jgi:hypothetical protein
MATVGSGKHHHGGQSHQLQQQTSLPHQHSTTSQNSQYSQHSQSGASVTYEMPMPVLTTTPSASSALPPAIGFTLNNPVSADLISSTQQPPAVSIMMKPIVAAGSSASCSSAGAQSSSNMKKTHPNTSNDAFINIGIESLKIQGNIFKNACIFIQTQIVQNVFGDNIFII